MNTDIKNAVKSAEYNARYDEQAKKLVGHKIILAHILASVVDEFAGMNPNDIVKYIEGEPYISVVPIEPGLTNSKKDGEKIAGFNTENAEANEGMIRFDIVFYVRMKDGIAQMIINLEIQKKEPSEYSIINRAIFYLSRLISSQKGRDFVKSNYNDIKKTYSIWICFGMEENCIDHICLTDRKILGSYNWNGDLGILNIIMIGISSEIPKHDEKYELHRLLGTMFSEVLTADQKIDVMENEYGIEMEEKIREEFNTMCNLSEGFEERVTEKTTKKIILKIYENNFTLDQISTITEKTIEEIEKIIADNTVTV